MWLDSLTVEHAAQLWMLLVVTIFAVSCYHDYGNVQHHNAALSPKKSD